MVINITDNLKVESEIPLLMVENFQFVWAPNQHALLILSGYVNSNSQYEVSKAYDSKIKVWLDKGNEDQILFYGYLVKIVVENIGKTTKLQLMAKSGSYKLDQQAESRSFQNVEKTYAEIVKQTVENAGGRTICEAGLNSRIGKPLIRYDETVWEFSKRLASQLGTCVVPDLETCGQYFWFGMRQGNIIPAFSEKEFAMNVCRRICGGEKEIIYEVESRDFHKIGDRTRFCNLDMIVCRVSALFENGDLIFKYSLKQNEAVKPFYQNRFIGLGLEGTVLETRLEQVKIALDIDGGDSTGDYFYDWYPETGNALYAVPEVGTRILLYFGSRDEREGFALHCLSENADHDRSYKSRSFDTKEGNSVHLYEGGISFSNNKGHSAALGDGVVSIRSVEKVNISAQGAVKVKARRITINTPDELNICQG